MNTQITTLRRHAGNWALCAAALIAVLFLNAYLEHKHSETETAAITAQIDNDRAAEHAAIHQQRATAVATKE
jgi:uncharacterized protein YdbL (DUF1318 family)